MMIQKGNTFCNLPIGLFSKNKSGRPNKPSAILKTALLAASCHYSAKCHSVPLPALDSNLLCVERSGQKHFLALQYSLLTSFVAGTGLAVVFLTALLFSVSLQPEMSVRERFWLAV